MIKLNCWLQPLGHPVLKTNINSKLKNINCLNENLLFYNLLLVNQKASFIVFFSGSVLLNLMSRCYWRTLACRQRTHFHCNANQGLLQRASEEATPTTPFTPVR